MGIRGLSTFFYQNPEFFTPYKLHDSFVIIDGNNLVHALYFDYRVNFMYGGDYKKYADSIKKHFLAYLECNITPILIFDGGVDQSEKKLKTTFERVKQRLSDIEYIVRHGSCSGKVLPLLAREIFLSVLVELDITFAQCDFEADDQITALANYYKCPVISADSDFYIYDINNGFINMNSIDMIVCLETNADGKEYKFLNCNMYHIDEFVSCFPGIDKNVLPLFGTLIGNDYVEGKEFENFFSNIQLPKYKGRKLFCNSKQKKMIGLLCWLKNKSQNEAVNQIVEYIKKDKREYAKSIIERSVNSYELLYCNLSSIIDRKLYDCKIEMSFSSRLVTPCGNSLPVDFMVKFHGGEYCSFFINAIVSHKNFLRPQIEDISFPSSFTCSRYIRQIMYGILIRHHVDNKICDNKKCLAFIEEHDRQRNTLRRENVEPIFSLEGNEVLPTLDELSNLEQEKCKLILITVLGVNSDILLNLPEEWQLLISCYNYWLRNSIPHSRETFIYALIINLIYFSLIKHKNASDNHFKCPHRKSTEGNCLDSSVICILSKITRLELKFAGKNVEKYIYKPSFNHGNPLILHVIHSYSQIQACILNTITLNKLLGHCMRNPDLRRCFSGTMLHNLAKDISSRSNPLLFVAEILGRETNVYSLFITLYSIICQNVPPDFILKNQVSHKKPKKKSKNLESSSQSFEHVCNKFEALNRFQSLANI